MHEISWKWARYKLSLKGSITTTKTFLLPQSIYLASVVETKDNIYEKINMCLHDYVNTGSTKIKGNKNWINQDILYGPKSEG